LWREVLADHVECIVSDHSPYRPEEKDAGREDIFKATLGLSIIQTMYPAVLDEGFHRRGLTLQQFAALSAAGAARVLGLYPRKGSISVGADADFALYDLDATWEVRRKDLFSRHRWTPLEGRTVCGKVAATIRRGEVIYADGQVMGRPGSGRFIRYEHRSEDPASLQTGSLPAGTADKPREVVGGRAE
jgi:allantoinase